MIGIDAICEVVNGKQQTSFRLWSGMRVIRSYPTRAAAQAAVDRIKQIWDLMANPPEEGRDWDMRRERLIRELDSLTDGAPS